MTRREYRAIHTVNQPLTLDVDEAGYIHGSSEEAPIFQKARDLFNESLAVRQMTRRALRKALIRQFGVNPTSTN